VYFKKNTLQECRKLHQNYINFNIFLLTTLTYTNWTHIHIRVGLIPVWLTLKLGLDNSTSAGVDLEMVCNGFYCNRDEWANCCRSVVVCPLVFLQENINDLFHCIVGDQLVLCQFSPRHGVEMTDSLQMFLNVFSIICYTTWRDYRVF